MTLSRQSRFWALGLRLLVAGLFGLIFGGSPAAEQFFGIFLQGQKIGYMSVATSEGPKGSRSVVLTKLAAQVLGSAMQMEILSDALSDASGKLTDMTFTLRSSGREQRVTAKIQGSKILVTRSSDSATEKKELKIPDGATLVDDPTVAALKTGAPKAGTRLEFYSFDPTALAIVKNAIIFKGKTNVEVGGKTISANWLVVEDPRANADLYLSDTGELILSRSLFGIEMRPTSREEAVGNPGYMPSIDLASASRVVPDKPIPNPRAAKQLVLRLSGKVPARLTSSAHQTVKRDASGVTLTISPVRTSPAKARSIAEVGQEQPEFLRQVDLMPADSQEFRELAAKIVGSEKNSLLAAQKIAKYVFGVMRPNASIGVIRDAGEVLKTKEGVCRDYAILTCTLLRSAGIPAKLVTGAVYAEGAFYYHAWVEAWVGENWEPMDPTMNGAFDATHITFNEGNPDIALVMFTLDGVKIRVVSSK